MYFVKLTARGGQAVWVNLYQIAFIHRETDHTALEQTNNEIFLVKESPEEILSLPAVNR